MDYQQFNDQLTIEFQQLEQLDQRKLTDDSIKKIQKFKSQAKLALSQSKSAKVFQTQNFISQIKKFKRKVENKLKANQTDYQAFKQKHQVQNRQIVDILYEAFINYKTVDNVDTFFNFKDFINTPDYPILSIRNDDLSLIAYKVFSNIGYYKNNLSIQSNTLDKLLIEMNRQYNVISYHNWSHAFFLFHQFTWAFYQSELKDYINQQDLFAGQISCLAHDMNHKGVNNDYKIQVRNRSQLEYCNISVLENMHVARFFELVQHNDELDIFSQIQDKNQLLEIKRFIISSILATDMAKHNKYIEKIKLRRTANNQLIVNVDNNQIFDPQSIEDRKFITNILTHACDIGNTLTDFSNYIQWSTLCIQEFQDQTLKEAEKGYKVTAMFQYSNKEGFYKGQQFFIGVLVLPLWQELAYVFPKLQSRVDEGNKNIKIIKQKQENVIKQNSIQN